MTRCALLGVMNVLQRKSPWKTLLHFKAGSQSYPISKECSYIAYKQKEVHVYRKC